MQTHVSRLPLGDESNRRTKPGRDLVGNGVKQPQRLRSFDFDSFARATPQLPARQWTRSSRLDRSQISGRLLEALSLSQLSRLILLTEAAASSRSFSSSHTQGVLSFSPFLFFFSLSSFFSTRFNYPATSFVSAVAAYSLRFLDVDPSREEEHEFSPRNTSFIHDLRPPTVGAIVSSCFLLGFRFRGIGDKDGYKILY